MSLIKKAIIPLHMRVGARWLWWLQFIRQWAWWMWSPCAWAWSPWLQWNPPSRLDAAKRSRIRRLKLLVPSRRVLEER
ncbi:uncharacterized protein B0H64DRAFT_407617 [Chaetomium fimeti]|uniref:Uncharacterized protein n=1 Tax=Chaetomium fimeti TaxID=1854472 RepID=A0AAE0LPI5_9PEZI|nr:hypothetical protein B0H64DRAFT_407617 [Chaetomium fimeti]